MRNVLWAGPAMLLLGLLALRTPTVAGVPVVPAGGVVDLAGGATEVAPGSLIRIQGSELASAEARAASFPLPETLEGVSVLVDDGQGPRNAPIVSVSPVSIDAQLPYTLAGDRVRVLVRNEAGDSAARDLPLAASAPRFLTNGPHPLATLPDGTPVTLSTPAEAGGKITFYAAGLGPVDPPRAAGEPGGTGAEGNPLNWTTLPVQILVGGREAPIDYVGLMPGSAGVYQINCRLSANVASGVRDVLLLAGSQVSQAGLALAVSNMAAPAREFFVSPKGTEEGDGSRDKPWDLATALRQPAAVRPGDTIWMLGGDYGDGKTVFESALSGEEGKPIVLRQARGQRATIQGGMRVQGKHAWYWGFEVANRFNADRLKAGAPFSFDIFGPNTKFINLVVHDTGQGFGWWIPAVDSEIYGSLSFYNGHLAEDRGHGHAVYTQNREGTKTLHDNIVFSGFAVGIHAYGSDKAWVEGYDMRGNVAFDSGYLSGGRTALVDNILFGVGRPLDRITVEDNFTYSRPEDQTGYSRIGWSFGPGPNGTASIRNNRFIGGQFPVQVGFWKRLTFTGNVTYTPKAYNFMLNRPADQDLSGYTWDANTHYGSRLFFLDSTVVGVEALRDIGLERNSRFEEAAPTGVWTIVRPNKYEAGRANVVIYNWDNQETVNVDVSKVLKPGARYELRDSMDFYGEPVLGGTYEGGALTVPMAAREPMRPTGENLPVLPRHTLPQFGVFILMQAE